MKLSNVNPMARYEYKLAKENRRLAEIDLKKTEVETMGDRGMEDVLVARTIANRIAFVLVAFAICATIASVNDVFQNHDNQTNITACERALTQTQMSGDCSTGKIGTAVKK